MNRRRFFTLTTGTLSTAPADVFSTASESGADPRSGRTTLAPSPFGDPNHRPEVLGILDLVQDQQEPLPLSPATASSSWAYSRTASRATAPWLGRASRSIARRSP